MTKKKKTNKGIITFDSGLKEEILSGFGKAVDKEGYIVEINDPSVRVITPEGEEIYIDEFAGIRMRGGAEIFIKSDLPSLIKLVDDLKQESEFPPDPIDPSGQIPFEYEKLTDEEYWKMRDGWREAKFRNREARWKRGERSFYGFEDDPIMGIKMCICTKRGYVNTKMYNAHRRYQRSC